MRVSNTVRQLFPEFETLCRDLTGATAAAIIYAGLAPEAIRQQSEADWVAHVLYTSENPKQVRTNSLSSGAFHGCSTLRTRV